MRIYVVGQHDFVCVYVGTPHGAKLAKRSHTRVSSGPRERSVAAMTCKKAAMKCMKEALETAPAASEARGGPHQVLEPT